MITETEYIAALKTVKEYINQLENKHKNIKKDLKNLGIVNDKIINKDTLLIDAKISTRAKNLLEICIERTKDYIYTNKLKLRDFDNLSKTELIGMEGMGKKTLKEIEDYFKKVDIRFVDDY